MAPKAPPPAPTPPPPPEPPQEDPKIKLRQHIESQEHDIVNIRNLLEALVDGEGHSFRDAKILVLFKQNREMNLVYERERTNNSKLKFQVSQLQQEVFKKRRTLQFDSHPAGTSVDATLNEQQQEQQPESVVKEETEKQPSEVLWKGKFEQVSHKLDEVQSARTCLSAEVIKLRHALQREVGEHIPIAKVLEEGGEWKGRSQQISLLKDKVRELKAKLHRSEFEELQRFQIQAFHTARRKEFERLAIEFLALREELLCQKRKLEGILARKNHLETEIRAAKEKMAVLVRKSENDDRLITALRLEVESYRQITGPVQFGEKVGGPLQLDLLHKEHKLAAAFSDLKKQCYQQELEIQAQAELISHLRAVASAAFEKEVNIDSTKQSTAEAVKV